MKEFTFKAKAIIAILALVCAAQFMMFTSNLDIHFHEGGITIDYVDVQNAFMDGRAAGLKDAAEMVREYGKDNGPVIMVKMIEEHQQIWSER